MTTVVLTGGVPHAHDFATHRRELGAIARTRGDDVVEIDDPEQFAAVADDATVLVVSGLWWRMHGSAYDTWRDQYAYSPSLAAREALSEFVGKGGGLLALHTTSICFDDWPEWGRIVGGWWRWGESSHPPPARVEARIDASHPLAAGLPPTLALEDEVYGGLGLADDVSVFGWARRDAHDDEQPVIWTHTYGEGRVAYDAFGHDERSLTDPAHRAVIERALHWVGGE